jgi:hypothetical protein
VTNSPSGIRRFMHGGSLIRWRHSSKNLIARNGDPPCHPVGRTFAMHS